MGKFIDQPEFATEIVPFTATASSTPWTDKETYPPMNGAILWCGADGDISVVLNRDKQVVTFEGVRGGTFLPVVIDYVVAAGTTATGLVAVK